MSLGDDPDLLTVEIGEDNKANITPGVYVHIDSLTFWLKKRELNKTARDLRTQALDGIILGDVTKVNFSQGVVRE